MDLRLDEEQLELRDTVRRLCADRFGYEALGRREEARVDRDAWRALADCTYSAPGPAPRRSLP